MQNVLQYLSSYMVLLKRLWSYFRVFPLSLLSIARLLSADFVGVDAWETLIVYKNELA